MSDHKCQNGDIIRVGGVYATNSTAYSTIAATGFADDDPYSIIFLHKDGEPDGIAHGGLVNELPRDEYGYYIWNGGPQPVPDGWEIIAIDRDYGDKKISHARHIEWGNTRAFRVVSTGEESNAVEPFLSRREHKVTNPEVRTPLDVQTAEQFLAQAASLMAERAKDYDQPSGERSTGKAVHAFNAITGRDLTEAEGWLFMSLVKRVRQYSGDKFHRDSAEDAVAYAALEAEALARGE